MSKGVNKWIGIGNCCADPEVRYTADGKAVTNVSIACNDSYNDKKTGQKVDKTEFVRTVFFDKIGEIAGKYLKKGSKVYIEGAIRTRKWEDSNGQTRYSTEIIVKEMNMLGGNQEGQSAAQPQAAPQQQTKTEAQVDKDGWSDDIPFS